MMIIKKNDYNNNIYNNTNDNNNNTNDNDANRIKIPIIIKNVNNIHSTNGIIIISVGEHIFCLANLDVEKSFII